MYKVAWLQPSGLKCAFFLETCRNRNFYIFLRPPGRPCYGLFRAGKPGAWIRAAVQQHVSPKTIFEIVAAAIQEAEKMFRETKNVHEFNAQFKLSRGIPSLLQESNGLDPDHSFSLEQEHYDRAKLAIEPSGEGLGRRFLQRFLPPHSVSNNNTLQTAITAYYQERWREEGQKRLDESQRTLWQAKETSDQEKMDAALELEKQARGSISYPFFIAVCW